MQKLFLFVLFTAATITLVSSWTYKDKINATVANQFLTCEDVWHQCPKYKSCQENEKCSISLINGSQCIPNKCQPIYNSTINNDESNITIYEGPGCYLNCYNTHQPSTKDKTIYSMWEEIFTCPGFQNCLNLLVQFSFKLKTVSVVFLLVILLSMNVFA